MAPLYLVRTLTGSNLLVVFYGKEFEELFLLTLTVGGIAAGQLLALFAGCSLAPRHVAKYINEQGQAGHF
ncbi:hypothetical protein BDZ91DRAFT_749202 [Kalaharituber pfeilii]|nr:hypothetical protein BDZ91DRAFT_749202 [Kalaharituber pfeilii]